MNSEEQQYTQHQMDLLTHNNASTGALCLNPEYPWFHQHGHFQIFSLFLLQSGPCGSGRTIDYSSPGRTASCNSCMCGARARPRLLRRRRRTTTAGGSCAGRSGRRGRTGWAPVATARARTARPCAAPAQPLNRVRLDSGVGTGRLGTGEVELRLERGESVYG